MGLLISAAQSTGYWFAKENLKSENYVHVSKIEGFCLTYEKSPFFFFCQSSETRLSFSFSFPQHPSRSSKRKQTLFVLYGKHKNWMFALSFQQNPIRFIKKKIFGKQSSEMNIYRK